VTVVILEESTLFRRARATGAASAFLVRVTDSAPARATSKRLTNSHSRSWFPPWAIETHPSTWELCYISDGGQETQGVPNAEDKLKLAQHHLDRVLGAWDTPKDWDDLSLYGFYCLEAAIEAAAIKIGLRTSKKHWEKADVAVELHKTHGLPDVTKLLHDLNDARKSAAYGDIPAPDLNAEDVASEIEHYVNSVAELVEGVSR